MITCVVDYSRAHHRVRGTLHGVGILISLSESQRVVAISARTARPERNNEFAAAMMGVGYARVLCPVAPRILVVTDDLFTYGAIRGDVPVKPRLRQYYREQIATTCEGVHLDVMRVIGHAPLASRAEDPMARAHRRAHRLAGMATLQYPASLYCDPHVTFEGYVPERWVYDTPQSARGRGILSTDCAQSEYNGMMPTSSTCPER